MKTLHILFQVAEFMAALVGTVYISKYRVNNLIRYFVYFLWFNFIVELLGNIPMIIYRNESLSFLKSTFLYRNAWMYNLHSLISIVFYTFFFMNSIVSEKFKFFLRNALVLFLITAILNLLITDVFFKAISSYTMISGVCLILISVFLYFFEMLNSEKILLFNENLVFYVAIGSIILHLVVTPLFIFDKYFLKDNVEFIKIRALILPSAIIFAYTCYIIGFVVCLKKNKSY